MKFSAFLFLILALGCTKKEAPVSSEISPEQLVERGRSIYKLNCIACHNADPTKEGAVGPAVFGSDLQLIEARVMRAAYPDGFVPQRNTRQMVALPHLQKEIPALHAFLNSKLNSK